MAYRAFVVSSCGAFFITFTMLPQSRLCPLVLALRELLITYNTLVPIPN